MIDSIVWARSERSPGDRRHCHANLVHIFRLQPTGRAIDLAASQPSERTSRQTNEWIIGRLQTNYLIGRLAAKWIDRSGQRRVRRIVEQLEVLDAPHDCSIGPNTIAMGKFRAITLGNNANWTLQTPTRVSACLPAR